MSGVELSGAERYRLLVEWNDTVVGYPTGLCLHELFEAQLQQTPHAVAVITEDSAPLSYMELDSRANRLAHHLRGHGVGPETVVGVCLHRSANLVVALLGILKAGGAYLPLDPQYPADRLGYMLADSGAPLVITTAGLGEFTGTVIDIDELVDGPTYRPESGVTPQNAAYVIYTSGSTGRPKGVVVEHRGIVNRIQWTQDHYRLDGTDRVLQKTPYSFDVSVWEFFWPLATGATLVMARPDGHRDPAYLAEAITKHQITTVHFVPSMLRAFLAQLAQPLPCLRRVLCSGEALSPDLVSAAHHQLGRPLHNLYGPTEASVDVTATPCHPNEPVTIGRPIANTQTYILDSELNPVPVGVAGELFLSGVQLARGYLGQPALTAQRFIAHPHSSSPGQRLYRTGDLAQWQPDGTIAYLGRADHQVKIHGHRIELGEIETLLVQHNAVSAAVVVPHHPNPHSTQLVAYIQPAGPDVTTTELRQHLKQQLPDHMVPTHWITLAEFPLTASGKLDRKALPAPTNRRPALPVPYATPRTDTERSLVRIWESVLNLRPVGVHDPFTELGGQSLSATQVCTKVRQVFGSHLSPGDVLASPTIEELATVIECAQIGAAGTQHRIGPPPLVPLQNRNGHVGS